MSAILRLHYKIKKLFLIEQKKINRHCEAWYKPWQSSSFYFNYNMGDCHVTSFLAMTVVYLNRPHRPFGTSPNLGEEMEALCKICPPKLGGRAQRRGGCKERETEFTITTLY